LAPPILPAGGAHGLALAPDGQTLAATSIRLSAPQEIREEIGASSMATI